MLVNYLAEILPYHRSLSYPECRNCGTRPSILNYLFWPRQCQKCCHKFTKYRYLPEIAYVGIAIWLWISPTPELPFWLGMVLMIYFGVITIIDVEHRLVMHPVSLAGVVLGVGVGIWLHGFIATLLGGITGFGIFLLLYLLGNLYVRLVSRLRSRELDEALGFGDVNLAGVVGLMLGWPVILPGMALAILSAGLVSLLYLVVGVIKRRELSGLAIPYAPFLVLSALILIFFRMD